MKRSVYFWIQVGAGVALSTLSVVDTALAQVYRQGDTGVEVEQIQERLNLRVDGYYGADTAAAVLDFQSDYDLRCVDGVVGPETLDALGLDELITNPSQPCGETASSSSSLSTFGSNTSNTSSSGPYMVIVPGDTGDSPEDLRSEINLAVSNNARLRSAPQGSYIEAGSYDDYGFADAEAARLRALGFDARVIYR